MCRIIDIISFLQKFVIIKKFMIQLMERVIILFLSHYPIFSWKKNGERDSFLLYGHTHDSNEDAYYQSCLMKMVESDCQHVYKTEVRAIIM